MVRSRRLDFSLTTDRQGVSHPPHWLYHIILHQSSHKTKPHFFSPLALLNPHTLCLPLGYGVLSCIAHFSTRLTVVLHRLPLAVVDAAALVSQGAYRSLSRRFHRPP